MTIAHLLEEFGSSLSSAAPSLTEAEMESLKVASYEDGYKAGWEDALKSRASEEARVSDEFARNLQDLSFTYHEAHSQVLQSLGPFLQDMVDTLLPAAVRDSIGARVVEELSDMAREQSEQGIEIVTSTADFPTVDALLKQDFGFPVQAKTDETLAEGQVYLRMGQEERQIDMTSVMEGIRQAVAGLMDENERMLKHG